MPSDRRHLAHVDSRSFERELARNPLVIVPVGALEAHGPHLPLGADQIQAETTAAALAETLGAWIAPTIPYGTCPGTRSFPGTISLSVESLRRVTEEILSEFGRAGVRRLLVLSGHAALEHMVALRVAADGAVGACPGLRVVVLSDYDFVYELRGTISPPTDGHGGLLETSRVLSMTPELVGAERPHVRSGRSRFLAGDPAGAEWPESVVGDTAAASAELGSKVQEHVLARLVATVNELLPA